MDPTAVPSSTVPSSTEPALWKLRLVGALAIVAAVVFIGPAPFFRPELWAEDGAEFLAGPLVDGFWSCFRPIAFNFLLLPRLVAFFAVQFLPLWMTPVVFAWVPLLSAAYVLSGIVRDDMSWIHPDPRWRFVVVVSLAVVPALAEVTMALCNGTYIFGLAAFFLCLRDRPRFDVRTVVAMAVFMLSSPITILVPVIWAWRAVFEKADRATCLKLLGASLVPFTLMVVSALLHPFTSETGIVYADPPPSYGIASFDLVQLLDIFFSRLGIMVVGLPLLGERTTSMLMLYGEVLFWALALVAIGVLAMFWRVHQRIVLGVVLGVGLFPMMHLGRNYSFLLDIAHGHVVPLARWSLVAEVFVVVGFVAWAARARSWRRLIVIVPLMQLGQTTLSPRQMAIDWEKSPRPFWPVAEIIERQQRAIEAGEVDELLTPEIPVHPPGWARFQIRLRRAP